MKNILRKLLNIKRTKLLWIIISIASTATFGQFIIEESIQNYGFGLSTLMMSKQYYRDPKAALASIETYTKFHNACQKIMYGLYIGNPLTAIWFQRFMVSNLEKIKLWKETVNSALTSRDKDRNYAAGDTVLIKVELSEFKDKAWITDQRVTDNQALVKARDIVSKSRW